MGEYYIPPVAPYEYRLEAEHSGDPAQARAVDPTVVLLAQLDRIATQRDGDSRWVHQTTADCLERGVIKPEELSIAVERALAAGTDSRRLILTLGLEEEEVNKVFAGFVAIDLGFAPETGARIASSLQMMRLIGDVVDRCLAAERRRNGRRVRRLHDWAMMWARLRIAAHRTEPTAAGFRNRHDTLAVVGIVLVLLGSIFGLYLFFWWLASLLYS